MDLPGENQQSRILILEDVPTDAELMENALREAGLSFASRRVDTRDSFVQALAEFDPNIVLADYQLPSFDGRSALQIVQKTHPEVPVIVVSGVLGEGAVYLLKEGARDYVLKDNLARLAPSIRRALAEERDAKARRAAEEALRHSAAELAEAQRIAHLGSWILDLRSGMVSWSDELYRIFGLAPQPGPHKFGEYQRMLAPESMSRLQVAIDKTGHSGEPFELELMVRRADGTGRWITVRGEAGRDDGGAVAGIRCTALDITERKLLEEELRQHRAHLEDLVKRRTADLDQRSLELEQANLKLKELDRMKSMFIASMSHELRTPLNSIIGFTGILLQGLAGEVNAEQQKQLTIIRESANHLLDLINDIIDISKIEAGRLEFTLSEVDLAALVREVADSFLAAINSKGVALAVSAPASLRFDTDRKRIKQILVNLLGNAVKFTDRGQVQVALSVNEKSIEITIRDTGIGIGSEDIGKLFEPFSQLLSEGRRPEGTGLGLYISRKLAELLGGRITVASEWGRGSAFTLILPRATGEGKAAP